MLCLWVVGVPLAVFLAFYTYPRLGLEGLWIGLSSGMTLLALITLSHALALDWEREAKKVVFVLGRQRGENQRDSLVVGNNDREQSAAARRGILSLDVTVPVIGSRSLGGFPLAQSSLLEELDEFEMVELGGTAETGAEQEQQQYGEDRYDEQGKENVD